MFAPRDPAILLALGILLVMLGGYVAGRIHQILRRYSEQDTAYREGFDEASRTLFPLTVRAEKQVDEN
jgi:hypothetical protein